jgi:hypothetical protein
VNNEYDVEPVLSKLRKHIDGLYSEIMPELSARVAGLVNSRLAELSGSQSSPNFQGSSLSAGLAGEGDVSLPSTSGDDNVIGKGLRGEPGYPGLNAPLPTIYSEGGTLYFRPYDDADPVALINLYTIIHGLMVSMVPDADQIIHGIIEDLINTLTGKLTDPESLELIHLLTKEVENNASISTLRGPAPAHRWVGTSLQFQNPDGTWGDLVDLKGDKGEDGKDGTNAENKYYYYVSCS